MKKIIYLLMITLISIFTVGCENKVDVDIVTTSYIGYDLAKNIAGNNLIIQNIMPLGGEFHDFEPTPQNIRAINYSRLFIFLSLDLEPWVKNNIKQQNSLNLSESYEIDEHHDHGDNNNEDKDHDHDLDDDHDHSTLHFWTDPIVYLQLINVVLNRIIEIDPGNAEMYRNKANIYTKRINELHTEMDTFMLDKWDSQIFLAGHNSMSNFAERYHLDIRSIIKDYKPNADLTGPQLTSFKEEIIADDIHYIFTEELVEPRVANKLKEILEAQNYSLTLLELHGYHNISQNQFKEGITYADLFRQNIINIKHALSN